MKKVYLIMGIIAIITFVTGIPELVTGIGERGFDGVNYGRIIFPLLIGVISFWLFKKSRIKKES